MLGTSTRISNELMNLGLRPLGWLAEAGSPQFGVLYESTSIAAVYGTICSLVWKPWGQP